MSRPWTLEGLTAASVLVGSGAALAAIGTELNRTPGEVDLALWALFGRTPQQAIDRLNGHRRLELVDDAMRSRILAQLLEGPATTANLAQQLDLDEATVTQALTSLAYDRMVDADDPPQPAGPEAMRWYRPGLPA